MLYVGSRKNFMVKREKKIIFLPSVKKNTRQTPLFAECFFLTLGKPPSLPSVFFYTRQRGGFADCFLFDTRQSPDLPSVFFCRVFLAWHSAKSLFAECPKKNTRQKENTRQI